MKIPHVQIGGKCRCCGFREQNSALAHRDLQVVDGNVVLPENLYDDCPQARWYLMVLWIAFVPLVWYVFGWPLALFLAIDWLLFFRYVSTPEDSKWYGLRNVQEEYEGLLQSVEPRKRGFYIKHLDAALHPLFKQRDKAFRAMAVLGDESLAEIEFKMEQIREKSQTIEDQALIEMYRSQLKDLAENRKKFHQLQDFLSKFEASRGCVAESIRLLRNRILITEADGDDEEKLRILEDLKSLHHIYERVNRPADAPAETPPTRPEPHEPDEEEELRPIPYQEEPPTESSP